MITLVGHGTGAACIDFLMSSPTMGKKPNLLFHFTHECNLIPLYSTWIVPSSDSDVGFSVLIVGAR